MSGSLTGIGTGSGRRAQRRRSPSGPPAAYTLWETAVTAFPDVALFPSFGRLRDFLDVRQPQVRLYRRIVELRDAQLALTEERKAAHDRASPLNAFACAMAAVEE